MREFEKNVIAFCNERRLFQKGNSVLIALSGGGDSVALLHCLAKTSDMLGITIEAAHLNHALRSEESEGDEKFCREFCARQGVRLTVKRLSEGELVIRGESLETAARRVRRDFLISTARERKISVVATGHSRDDLAETLLQRLIRGTGPSGLTGILPAADDIWVRPLLGMTRRGIREYLETCGIAYREDSTNSDTVYFRNRIRHELIPFIEEHFAPNISESLARLAELSEIQEDYLDKQTEESVQKCCIYQGVDKILLDVTALEGYHTVLRQRVVRRCLEMLEGEGRDTDRSEVEHVLALLKRGRGEMDVTSRIRLGAGKSVAAFLVRSKPYLSVPVFIPGETDIPSGGRIVARNTSSPEQVDGRFSVLVGAAVIEKYGALTIGPVRRGEYIIPFGMARPVKVYDILSDSEVPKVLRDSTPVVRAGAVPVWIPGLKSAECLRLSGEERKAVFLLYENGPQWRR